MTAVSVIIPSHNAAAHIEQTVRSVLAQTQPDLELLLVDDGSSDGTVAIVQALGDPRVRVIVQANGGVCKARNRGIAEAQAPFICLLDHDDWWLPGKLQRQLQVMAEHPEAGVAYSTFERWHADPATGRFPPPDAFDFSAIPDDTDPDFSGWVHHQFLLDCWMLTSSSMFRREVFDRCGTFDINLPFSEDWDLWLRVAREFPFVQLRRPTVLYRMHASQGSSYHRPIDYRTRLLERTAAEHGLASRDGRAITPQQFHRQLARYHADHARGELQAGRVAQALGIYARAWRLHPLGWKYPAYALAVLAGWRGRALPARV
jgi:glycosyltransferase involved in cell wall biosynthesis